MTDQSGSIPQPVKEDVHEALKSWRQGETRRSSLADLLLYQQASIDGPSTADSATNQVLALGLSRLAQENLEFHKILVLRFSEGRPAHQVATLLSMAEGTIWRKQGEAIERLAEILQQEEETVRSERLDRFGTRLQTATYTRLFGRERPLATLQAQFLQPGPPWLIAIEGIGGIGKTSMADMLVRRLLGDARWHDFAWVTARHQTFNSGGAIKAVTQPALTTEALVDALIAQLFGDEIEATRLVYPQKLSLLKDRLRDRAHLIVIDNLESLRDEERLLESLRNLANPTKFLLTTRHSRYHEADIFHLPVPELDDQDALALIRQEAIVRNVAGITAADDEDLLPIVATVGGNPLALRLVVGQLHTHPLGRVLDDLHSARGQKATGIYDYIYRQAWLDLAEPARRVLLLLPLALESGGDFDYLAQMGVQGGLSPAQIGDALDELVGRNLVDSRGDLHRRRYSIHGLTRTFLQQQVLGWSEND